MMNVTTMSPSRLNCSRGRRGIGFMAGSFMLGPHGTHLLPVVQAGDSSDHVRLRQLGADGQNQVSRVRTAAVEDHLAIVRGAEAILAGFVAVNQNVRAD